MPLVPKKLVGHSYIIYYIKAKSWWGTCPPGPPSNYGPAMYSHNSQVTTRMYHCSFFLFWASRTWPLVFKYGAVQVYVADTCPRVGLSLEITQIPSTSWIMGHELRLASFSSSSCHLLESNRIIDNLLARFSSIFPSSFWNLNEEGVRCGPSRFWPIESVGRFLYCILLSEMWTKMRSTGTKLWTFWGRIPETKIILIFLQSSKFEF